MTLRELCKKILNNLKDSDRRFLNLAQLGLYNWMPDKMYLKRMGKARLGYALHLDPPRTFNEKIQWLKLYDRRPEYTVMVDKYRVKDYVAKRIGRQYIIPTIGVWDKPEDIDFESLPEKFVLKCNHNSGKGMCICTDKKTLDLEKARRELSEGLKQNYYLPSREWPYKNVKRKIIAEVFLEDPGRAVPEDYKVYCFNGKPKYIVVFHNRFVKGAKLSESVYDTDWVKQDISLDNHFAVSDREVSKPECLDELLYICRKLAKGYVQMRLDFYIIRGRIYFGEITLSTAGGFQPMIPEEMDWILGKQLKLKRPAKKRKGR